MDAPPGVLPHSAAVEQHPGRALLQRKSGSRSGGCQGACAVIIPLLIWEFKGGGTRPCDEMWCVVVDPLWGPANLAVCLGLVI